jgi:hypothetical protein
MKIWVYNLGNWIKDGYELLDWTENEKNQQDFLKKNGFNEYCLKSLGSVESNQVEIYSNEDEDIFLADIPTVDFSFYFLIPNYPSYLMYLTEYKNLYEIKKPDLIQIYDGNWITKQSITQIKLENNNKSESIYAELIGDDGLLLLEKFDYVKDIKGNLISNHKYFDWIRKYFYLED